MDATMLAALAEPNRLRIVELLADAPRTVGEIAAALGLRQPQVSKHLHTLAQAELVVVHPLGRRRVCALHRPALEELARWAGQLAEPGPDDDALIRYGAAIAAADPSPVTVHRTVPANRTAVWRAFTDPAIATRWWHPRHFTVAAFRLDPRPGGAVQLVLQEGNGNQHSASGHVHALTRLQRLGFTLDPLDPHGQALFTARHDLRLTTADDGTEIELTVTPSNVQPGAEAALAGLAIGWEQLLDNLTELAADGALDPPRGTGRARRA